MFGSFAYSENINVMTAFCGDPTSLADANTFSCPVLHLKYDIISLFAQMTCLKRSFKAYEYWLLVIGP